MYKVVDDTVMEVTPLTVEACPEEVRPLPKKARLDVPVQVHLHCRCL